MARGSFADRLEGCCRPFLRVNPDMNPAAVESTAGVSGHLPLDLGGPLALPSGAEVTR
ncbi:Hypothetical protein CAP_8440 [Chondromyces apiculatus DSM 436]|uniref:Uncharacterized protein n=1 Tax=Chondromyces apiculatus DSM 436 TaxID=1192034 RepID=A0A017SYA2_9BACT|nr:Hypothetical protein CAP_8440 [Chondromyces apiculatus DSM 436]